jgi:hypothetical protein
MLAIGVPAYYLSFMMPQFSIPGNPIFLSQLPLVLTDIPDSSTPAQALLIAEIIEKEKQYEEALNDGKEFAFLRLLKAQLKELKDKLQESNNPDDHVI